MQRAGGAFMGLLLVGTALASTIQLARWRAGNPRPSNLPGTSVLVKGDICCPFASTPFAFHLVSTSGSNLSVQLSPVRLHPALGKL